MTAASDGDGEHCRLEVRRLIPASPARVFAAWTDPELLQKWWGPAGVRCVAAEIDLNVGGAYRIANELPDGKILWISGVFERIERPVALDYTWVVETARPVAERVSLRFEAHARGTEVVVTHTQIPTAALRTEHRHGWAGCLEGLARYVAAVTQRPVSS